MTEVRPRTDATASTTRRRTDRRKVLAIVSAFSVLGIGAGITTLASWSQSLPLVGGVGGVAGIGASKLCIEESINGGAWAIYTGSVVLSFPSSVTTLSPGDLAYASIQLASCPTSTVAANVTIAPTPGANTTAFLTALNYAVNTGVTPANCSTLAGFNGGTSLIPAQSASTGSSAPFTLPTTTWSGSPSAPVAAPTQLCFQIGLPVGASAGLMGSTGTPSWTLSVTS